MDVVETDSSWTPENKAAFRKLVALSPGLQQQKWLRKATLVDEQCEMELQEGVILRFLDGTEEQISCDFTSGVLAWPVLVELMYLSEAYVKERQRKAAIRYHFPVFQKIVKVLPEGATLKLVLETKHGQQVFFHTKTEKDLWKMVEDWMLLYHGEKLHDIPAISKEGNEIHLESGIITLCFNKDNSTQVPVIDLHPGRLLIKPIYLLGASSPEQLKACWRSNPIHEDLQVVNQIMECLE